MATAAPGATSTTSSTTSGQQSQQQAHRHQGRKGILVPIDCSRTSPEVQQPLLVEVAGAASPTQPDSGLGTPCISSASTNSSGCSSGRRRRANQPLRTSSSDDDSAEDTSSCASSTTCQAYQRVPGFHDHAHTHPVTLQQQRHHGRRKEKRAMLHQPLPAVVAAASVPMRNRHLPKSMWQEPDVANYSPATVLPRLALHRSVDDVSDLGLAPGLSATSPFKVSAAAGRTSLKPPIRTVLNLDPSEVLQRRLFEVALRPGLGEQQKKRPLDRLQPIAQRPPVSSKSSFVSNNDPCLSDSNKFPYLARTGTVAATQAESLDCLQQHQNHQRDNPSQMLAEVAKQL